MKNIDVSIIIVNYNTCNMTKECIDSIFKKTLGVSFEVILVDNASTDGSKEFFERDERINYIYNNENVGFGRANNIGVEVANGRNILFLNSDTILLNDAISLMSMYLDENGDVGCVGGNLYSSGMRPLHSFLRFDPLGKEVNELTSGLYARLLFGENIDHNHSKKPLTVKSIVGADMMIRKPILHEVGGAFNPVFFMYCEETELCHRIRNNGYLIKALHEPNIVHLEGGSFTENRMLERMGMYRDSLKIYCNLHYNKAYSSLVSLMWKLTIWTRIIGYGCINSPKKSFWIKVKNYCYR